MITIEKPEIPSWMHRSPPSAEDAEKVKHIKKLLRQTWTLVFDSCGVKAFTTEHLPGLPSNMPICRGEIDIPAGMDPLDPLRLCSTIEARLLWDERAERIEAKTLLADGGTEVYVIQKGVWPIVSARDFVVKTSTAFYDEDLGAFMVVQGSIDCSDVPPTTDKVRAVLRAATFMVVPNAESPSGYRLVYITNVDICGTVPAKVLQLVSRSTPMCIHRMIDLLQKTGAPPKLFGGIGHYLSWSKIDLAKGNSTFRVVVKDAKDNGNGMNDAEIRIDPKIYPSGVSITIDPNDVSVVVAKIALGVTVSAPIGTPNFDLSLSRLPGGQPGDVVVNGNAI